MDDYAWNEYWGSRGSIDYDEMVEARAAWVHQQKRIDDLSKKLDQAIDMLDTNARAHLLAEWAKP
jgi:hypothetical protein